MSDDTSDLLEQLRTRHVKLGFNEVTESLFSAAADEIERLRAESERLREASKKAYQDSLDAVEKIQSDVLTDLGKHHKSAFGSTTAKDWMIAIAKDIHREITARAALGEEEKGCPTNTIK